MNYSTINFFGRFSNLKLERRCNGFFSSLVKHESVSVHKISRNWAEAMGNYRMLDNEKVTLEGLKEGLTSDCGIKARCPHVLLIQDTSQPNYEGRRGRIEEGSGLGIIGDNKCLGYFLHPTLAMNADSGDVYGVSDINTWIREEDRQVRKEWERKELPIEKKESHRWIDSIKKSKTIIKSCDMVTCIADREGDIFELFSVIPDEKYHLLIRSRSDRKIEGGCLYEYLDDQPMVGTYELKVRGDIRKKTKSRKAIIEVKIARVHLIRPKNLNRYGDKYAEKVEIYAIEAKEIEETASQAGNPIHWRILTTHQVESIQEARQIISWYSKRWYIEQLFRLLQNDGFNIESSELEKGTSIIKLGIFALGASIKVMQMLLASKWESTQRLEDVFTGSEIDCLKKIAKDYEGKTAKQANVNKPGSLMWAVWIIARMGGWKGYASQRAPGPITFFKGLQAFYLIHEGWSLARDIKQHPFKQCLKL